MEVKIIKSNFSIITASLCAIAIFLGICVFIYFGLCENLKDLGLLIFNICVCIILTSFIFNRLYFYNDYMVIRQFPRKYRLEYSAIKRIFSTGLFGYVITLRDGKNYMVFMPYITKKLKEQFLVMQKTYSDIEIYL